MAVTVLKLTENFAVVKVSGASNTISLATDLLSPSQVVSGTPRVNITFAQWNISGGAIDAIIVVRNGVNIMHLAANGSTLDLAGNNGCSDNIENASDLVVTTTGTGEAYITLRKVSGYKSKIQPELYSGYDNPNSTTA